MGSRLTLDSDLERLLNNDNLFKEPFADELALYEDILRYPYYHHDIWDIYDKDDTTTEYLVADLTGDGLNELVILGRLNTMPATATVVKSDGTFYRIEDGMGFSVLDNGVIRRTEFTANDVIYFDIKKGETWIQKGSETLSLKENPELKYTGEEAVRKIKELSAGTNIVTTSDYIDYDIYKPENFKELVVFEKSETVDDKWKNAYINQIEEKSTKEKMEYSLIYIDEDDIPELIIGDPVDSRNGGLYTYNDGSCVELTYLTLRRIINGYAEKNNIFAVYFWWLEDEGYYIYEMKNGSLNQTDNFLIKHTSNGAVYTINDKEVTESEYNETYDIYSADFSEVTYCTYDEIIEKLS